ncbi:hypothetical protein [Actinocorallia sp. A-T 12471]|uniref:hypothetical protein n=1 Tax=Actinocorallia sp. A-T 12471 TaxID=3089813 RepID=UPI0029CB512F|nr:hypothetical protein [Actinocorallia sp. A-T 12471]MDX6741616.1 hypothetical protein [Actinocorallia sp. A-T 12471]
MEFAEQGGPRHIVDLQLIAEPFLHGLDGSEHGHLDLTLHHSAFPSRQKSTSTPDYTPMSAPLASVPDSPRTGTAIQDKSMTLGDHPVAENFPKRPKVL